MAKKKFKSTTVTAVTPKGMFLYPYLSEPDTKFDDDGEWRCDIVLTPEAFEETEVLVNKKKRVPLKKVIDTLCAQAEKEAKRITRKAKQDKIWTNEPYEEHEDPEGNLTGEYRLKSKQKAIIRKGDKAYHKSIQVLDGKLNKVPQGSVQIWTGTVGRLGLELRTYYIPGSGMCGVSCRLKNVQILQLVNGNSQDEDPEELGFEADGEALDVPEVGDAPDLDEEDEDDDFNEDDFDEVDEEDEDDYLDLDDDEEYC